MNAETIFQRLDPPVALERRSDGFRASPADLDVRGMATLMLEHGVRLITLTALPDATGEYRVIYHWDVDGDVVNISVLASSGCIASIADILPAADWVEREIRDYYALEFGGRAETPTLMLREGDEPGLFSRTCELGNECDPAETARQAVAADSEGV